MMHRNRRNNHSKIPIVLGLLVGSFFNLFSLPARAQELFGNNGIRFDVDTIIEFEFIESNGAFQSTFGVINLDTGEKTPLLVEVKPSDRFQDPNQPSTFQPDLGVNKPTDFQGTPGNTVPDFLVEFEFQANTNYAFYLESTYNGRFVNILYSTDLQNPSSRQQIQFDGGFSSLSDAEGTLLLWDDTGIEQELQERDFDDFVVRSGGFENCRYDE